MADFDGLGLRKLKMNKKGKELIFLMDDNEHIIGDNECCGIFGEKCKCGGIMHFQFVYDGIFYRCDRCGKYR